MADLYKNTGTCPHCNSSDMKYYGFTLNYIRYYYVCLTCHKFTEYHITSKKLVFVESSSLILFAGILAIYTLLADSKPLLALLLSLGFTILFMLLNYKQRWSYFKVIPLDKLPDRLIFPAAGDKIGFIIRVAFSTALLGYISVFIYNTIRKY
jgi:hypothetical protein